MRIFRHRLAASVIVPLFVIALANAFAPLRQGGTATKRLFKFPLLWASNKAVVDKEETYIFYSPNFHRHVVLAKRGGNESSSKVVESFLWLDQAQAAYPTAKIEPFLESDPDVLPMVAGGGVEEDTAYNSDEFSPPGSETTYHNILPTTNKDVLEAYENIISTPDGVTLLGFFSPSDQHYLKERIVFLLSPSLPNASSSTEKDQDWPKIFNEGYGANLTPSQVTTAIMNIGHLLIVRPLEANSRKFPVDVYYRELQLPLELMSHARVELDNWLWGASPSDIATFAFLYHIGVSWDQCRIILGAFSLSLISCDLDPSWELLYRRSIRKTFSEESIHYLRARLQLSPTEVFALIKMHSRISLYTTDTLKSHLNEIQSSLNLTSGDVQYLVYRNPSILGVSKEKLRSQIAFLSEKVNLSTSQIRSSVLKLPSLLQYSVESNLVPKFNYLTCDVGINLENFTSMVIKSPLLLGLSLKQRIVVTVEGFKSECGMSNEEVSRILISVPQLFSLNWQTNVKKKIEFLGRRLNLSQPALRSLLLSVPRVLMHSIDRSLEPKIQKLESASITSNEAIRTIVSNPSLLLTSMSVLNHRIETCIASNNTVEEYLKPRRTAEGKASIRRTRTKRGVVEFSGDKVTKEFSDVAAAADMVGTSKANMYNIIKTGRVFHGKTFAWVSNNASNKPSARPSLVSSKKKLTTANDRFYQELRANLVPDQNRVRLVEMLRNSSVKRPDRDKGKRKRKNRLYLQAFVSGRTYPPEASNQARGREKAGGLAMYLPQLRGNLLQTAAENVFSNQLMSTPYGGSRFCHGLIVLGYIYIKPSRNRCGLYVCRDILRIIAQLLQLEASCPDLPNSVIDIDIFTDSNYAWNLLKNNTSLLRWGSHTRQDEIIYDGEMDDWMSNTDILYPLSRTFYRVVNQEILPVEDKSYAKEINIRFRHESEIGLADAVHGGLMLDVCAEQAAAWQYERGKEAIKL